METYQIQYELWFFCSAVGGVVAALSLSDEEFKAKYNRMKPSKKSVIIFTSKTGDRARRTVAALEGLGYEK